MTQESDIASEEYPTILVVVDKKPERNLLKRRLKREDFHVEVCQHGEEGLENVKEGGIDLILVDTQLAHMSGHQMIREIRRDYPSNQLPIIAMTPSSNPDDMVQVLEDGANDVVEKPFDFDLILARLDNQIKIKRTNERIQQLNRRDPRTLLYNREYLLEQLDEELKRVQRDDLKMYFMIVLIEDFWGLNQRHGFKAADEVFDSFASIITETIREGDIAGRYGENKYGVIFTDTKPDQINDVLTAMLDALGEEEFRGYEDEKFTAEATAGLVSIEGGYGDIEQVVAKTGQALEEALNAGEPYRIKSL